MIRLIAAVDRRNGLAKGGLQPWSIPKDERRFADLTKAHGGNLLMGHKTFQVIGRPLLERRNFVAGRQFDGAEGVEAVSDLQNFLDRFHEDLWVIGGASIYEQTIAQANEIYLTHIMADFGCDQLFPDLPPSFKLTEESPLLEENGFIFSYALYQRPNTN